MSLLLLGCGGRGAAAAPPDATGPQVAQVEKSSDQTGANYSSGAAISWDQTNIDTSAGALWSAGAPTKFVVPPGLNGYYGTFYATVTIDNLTASQQAQINIRKNGNVNWLGAGGATNTPRGGAEATATRLILQCSTQKVLLTTGDEFDVFLQTFNDSSIDISAARSSFAVHIVSTNTGCLVYKAADATGQNYNFSAVSGFDSEVYDADAAHDTSTNNGRITVPSAWNTRLGIVRARIRLDAVSTGADCQIDLLKNGVGITAWLEIGAHSGNMGDTAGSTFFIQVDSQPHTLTTSNYYEVRLRNTDSSVTFVAAYSTFGLEVLPASPKGVLAKLNADAAGLNYSAGGTISWGGTDVYDADAAHDPSGTPTQIIIPSAWNGLYGIAQTNVYADSVSAFSSDTLEIQKDTGGGATSSYDGFGGWGGYGTDVTSTWMHGRSQILQLATGDKYTVQMWSNDSSITLQSESSTFGLRILEV